MIVELDFPDHWKTRTLVSLSGDEVAVRCLLRFWAHCQQRRRWRFTELNAERLALICDWRGNPLKFWDAMLATFLDKDGEEIIAHDWEQVNGTLVGRWQGGRSTARRFGKRPPPIAMPEAQLELSSELTPNHSREQKDSDKSRLDMSRAEKSTSAHAEFIAKWTADYRKEFGDDYAFQRGKDAKAVKLLLAMSKKTPDELMVIAHAAWKHGGFFCKSASSICGFNSKFNEIRNELNGTHSKTPTSKRNAGTFNQGGGSEYRGMAKSAS
jgi:hypothetical protein